MLELFEIELISIFVPAVIIWLGLNRVIGEMDHVVLAVVKFVAKGASAKVPFFEKEYFHILIDEHPHSDVEFTIFY